MTSPPEIPGGKSLVSEADEMEVDLVRQPDIVPGPEPVRPSRKRRILVEHIPDLDSRIASRSKKPARECVTELLRYRATAPDVREKPLASKKEEATRVFYFEVDKQLNKAAAQKEKFRKARKKKITGKGNNSRDISFDSVKGAVKEHITQGKKVSRPYGQQKGGAVRDKGHVLALNPVIKIGSQTEQMLGRISELFMKAAKDMEYETMLANGRLFVSANVQANVDKVAGLFLQDMLVEAAKAIVADSAESSALRRYSIGALASALDSIDPGDALTEQQERGAEMLSELSVGHHVDASVRQELRDALKLLQTQIRTRSKVHGPLSPADAAKALRDDKLKNHVIAVRPPDDNSHAEQYLALTLVKANYKERAVISGTKNPCSCCWLTLTLVLEHDYDLKFNNTAGLYWPKAARGVKLVADELKVKDISYLMAYFREANNLTNDKQRFMQHLTALKEVDLVVDVPVSGGGLKDLGLTQDQSARSVYMVDNPAFSVDKLPDEFAEYPGSPAYSYGSPRREDDADVELDEASMDDYDKRLKEWAAQRDKAEKQRKAKAAAKEKAAKEKIDEEGIED